MGNVGFDQELSGSDSTVSKTAVYDAYTLGPFACIVTFLWSPGMGASNEFCGQLFLVKFTKGSYF